MIGIPSFQWQMQPWTWNWAAPAEAGVPAVAAEVAPKGGLKTSLGLKSFRGCQLATASSLISVGSNQDTLFIG